MNICKNCSAALPEDSKFCPKCGTMVAPTAPQPEATPPEVPQSAQYNVQPQPGPQPDPQQQYGAYLNTQPQVPAQQNLPQQAWPQQVAHPGMPPQPPVAQQPWLQPVVPSPRKRSALVPVLIVVVVLLVLGGGALAVFTLMPKEKELPAVSYSYTQTPAPETQYTVTDQVFPSLYRSLESLVTLTATVESGTRDVLVKVEVPGLTQVYTQKLTLTPQMTKLTIKPPLMTGELNLNTEKDGQLVISVTDIDSGKSYIQDTKNIRIMSKYDVVWWTPQLKDSNNDNILAWMTPDSPGVLKLKRDAVDYLSYLSDGKIQSIVGYQDYGFENKSDSTWLQIIALQGAISDIEKVRYNNASFSISSDVNQRVMLPDDVLASKSGICIETSLLMASALQSAGMHVMLIFPPGHAQVAVETWPNSGEYFLIETTNLPMDFSADGFDKTVMYLTKDQWLGYVDGTGDYTLGVCYVLDCELGQKLGILPMSN